MSLSIRTNVASLTAQRNLASAQLGLDASLSRLSSGFRITKAGDDAAGLGISTRLESQLRSYNQAARNANDGLSVVQSTEAALNEQANVLTRLRELAMQAASDGVGNADRASIQKETTALLAELQRISQVAEFNGKKLLDGSASTLDFQVGIAGTASDVISFTTLNGTTAAASGGTAAVAGTPGSAAGVTAITAPPDANASAAASLFTAAWLAGSTPGAAQTATKAQLIAGGLGGEAAVDYSFAAMLAFDAGFLAAGGVSGQETLSGSTSPAQQAGLDQVAALGASSTGSGPASGTISAAYQTFASTLVSNGGDVSGAYLALPGGTAVNGVVQPLVLDLFAAVYAAVAGAAASTVDLTDPATTAALAALGYQYTPGTPGTPGTPATPASGGGLGVAGLTVASKASALASLAAIDAALERISSDRADLGATGNRLQSAIANIQAFSESISAANSRIKDVDVIEETSRLSRAQILMQAGASVLAQANQAPQLALKLLG